MRYSKEKIMMTMVSKVSSAGAYKMGGQWGHGVDKRIESSALVGILP